MAILVTANDNVWTLVQKLEFQKICICLSEFDCVLIPKHFLMRLLIASTYVAFWDSVMKYSGVWAAVSAVNQKFLSNQLMTNAWCYETKPGTIHSKQKVLI